tara:strand:- start:26579 stop:26905 length:327 start_codon:yes stop_codon:yes gene_type:complete
MNKLDVGQKIFYLAYTEGEGSGEVDEIYAECICIKRGVIKRTWKNGRIALENGKVLFESHCRLTHNECVADLIKHVEMLDAITTEFCQHNFEVIGTTCNLCGERKPKV